MLSLKRKAVREPLDIPGVSNGGCDTGRTFICPASCPANCTQKEIPCQAIRWKSVDSAREIGPSPRKGMDQPGQPELTIDGRADPPNLPNPRSFQTSVPQRFLFFREPALILDSVAENSPYGEKRFDGLRTKLHTYSSFRCLCKKYAKIMHKRKGL
jgi:hypothetical protein